MDCECDDYVSPSYIPCSSLVQDLRKRGYVVAAATLHAQCEVKRTLEWVWSSVPPLPALPQPPHFVTWYASWFAEDPIFRVGLFLLVWVVAAVLWYSIEWLLTTGFGVFRDHLKIKQEYIELDEMITVELPVVAELINQQLRYCVIDRETNTRYLLNLSNQVILNPAPNNSVVQEMAYSAVPPSKASVPSSQFFFLQRIKGDMNSGVIVGSGFRVEDTLYTAAHVWRKVAVMVAHDTERELLLCNSTLQINLPVSKDWKVVFKGPIDLVGFKPHTTVLSRLGLKKTNLGRASEQSLGWVYGYQGGRSVKTFSTISFSKKEAGMFGITYKNTTEPGWSGSPIFDEKMRIVGIHLGAIESSKVNYGLSLAFLAEIRQKSLALPHRVYRPESYDKNLQVEKFERLQGFDDSRDEKHFRNWERNQELLRQSERQWDGLGPDSDTEEVILTDEEQKWAFAVYGDRYQYRFSNWADQDDFERSIDEAVVSRRKAGKSFKTTEESGGTISPPKTGSPKPVPETISQPLPTPLVKVEVPPAAEAPAKPAKVETPAQFALEVKTPVEPVPSEAKVKTLPPQPDPTDGEDFGEPQLRRELGLEKSRPVSSTSVTKVSTKRSEQELESSGVAAQTASVLPSLKQKQSAATSNGPKTSSKSSMPSTGLSEGAATKLKALDTRMASLEKELSLVTQTLRLLLPKPAKTTPRRKSQGGSSPSSNKE